MNFIYKSMLGFIVCLNLVIADSRLDSKRGIESSQTQDSVKPTDSKTKNKWLDATIKRIKILFNQNNYVEEAKCDENWQKKVCDGSIMCYATKCFYPQANIDMMHRIFLENLVLYLKHHHTTNEKDRIAHLSKLSNLGLPKDNEEHNYTFINSYNVKCTYTLWRKDDKTLFFNLSGCLSRENQRVTRTLIQDGLGVIELYEHVAY
ncbi:hypothetical protein [Helicobacter trogontum]|uniref:Uncharacterized protein n=1 Tax=Helicobacter trogontum TaxID=50960 RepID=A0A4V6HZA6_9HELI|nr:hypothetical protein [Helicobacter trogontum]TLD83692.1 hypothetical protein LS81_003880 [Helicobacter trogontum]